VTASGFPVVTAATVLWRQSAAIALLLFLLVIPGLEGFGAAGVGMVLG
jgi:hypothetical protein